MCGAPPLYSADDQTRLVKPTKERQDKHEWFEFRRDYERLEHAPSFRRLQGKTQLFPGHELDFFRNRLTHSIEVAQIAKAIAVRLNSDKDKYPQFDDSSQKICPDIVEFAGLAHDLGHPPFGHVGEEDP